MNKNKGLTLIELLVAIFILLVGILAIIIMFPVGLQIINSSKMTAQANHLGQEKAELLISSEYDELIVGTTTESPLPIPFNAYSREITISYVDPSLGLIETETDKGIKKAEIKVYWQPPFGAGQRTIEITTLLSRR